MENKTDKYYEKRALLHDSSEEEDESHGGR
jgi:hypothetical protein